MRPIQEGNRKVTFGGVALLSMLAGAVALHADFPSYRDGVLVWLGIMIGGHVTQEVMKKTQVTNGGT